MFFPYSNFAGKETIKKHFIMDNEIWKDIEGCEDYEISSWGRVKSLKYGKERILKPAKTEKGYLKVTLCDGNGTQKKYRVHRLVAQAFLSNPQHLPCINHKDEDPTNNHVSNLEWCSVRYNNTYGTRMQRVTEKTRNGKLSKPVIQLTLDGNVVKVWASTMEIQRQLDWSSGTISACARGLYPIRYGFKWIYVEDFLKSVQ